MQWILHSPQDFTPFHDEFVFGQFHLRLAGNSITVEVEEETLTDELRSTASDLAQRYAKALKKHSLASFILIPIEDYVSMIDGTQTIEIGGSTASERVRRELRERFAKGVRLARNEILADDYPALRQCYEYLQDAREDKELFYVHVYKFIETVEDQFGGQEQLEKTLDVRKEVGFIKRLTNEPKRDARHPPEVGGALEPPSTAERETAISYANVVLQKFEQFSRN